MTSKQNLISRFSCWLDTLTPQSIADLAAAIEALPDVDQMGRSISVQMRTLSKELETTPANTQPTTTAAHSGSLKLVLLADSPQEAQKFIDRHQQGDYPGVDVEVRLAGRDAEQLKVK